MRGGEGRRGERESKRERYESFFELIFFFLKQARKKNERTRNTIEENQNGEEKKNSLFRLFSPPPPPCASSSLPARPRSCRARTGGASLVTVSARDVERARKREHANVVVDGALQSSSLARPLYLSPALFYLSIKKKKKKQPPPPSLLPPPP